MRHAIACLLLVASWPASTAAQSLEERIAATPDGVVRMIFAARSGVCGDGSTSFRTVEVSDEWESGCNAALVHVALQVKDHRALGVRTYVGGRWRSDSTARDLGQVGSREAAAFLLGIASQSEELEGDPVLPAALADSVVVWPSLLRLARNTALPEERRRTAVFWLGQAAESAAVAALDSVAADPHGDSEVRKQAVFALSQRPSSEGVPLLIRIARSNPDPELRKSALFWLGQSDDPRAVDLFEEILR
jgi:HEAT repeats